MDTPISKSQKRALSILSLPTVESYAAAGVALETAGYRADGVPRGSDWRKAAKLADGELIAALRLPAWSDDVADYGATR